MIDTSTDVIPSFSLEKKEIMLTIQNLTYSHPNKDILFQNINLTVNQHEKVALIGDNGTGKSTLLKIIAKELFSEKGTVSIDTATFYMPQLFGQFNELTISEALQVDSKLKALKAILNGNTSEKNFELLNDDWNIEERCYEALSYWKLDGLELNQKMRNLSGGQQTKVFLSAMQIHPSRLILLDEPSNHLDLNSRKLLYNYVLSGNSTMLIVSHDIQLLRLVDSTAELSAKGITKYGGNYDFYVEQKQIETNALFDNLKSKEKELNKAKEIQRKTLERKNKSDAQGKKKQKNAGVSKMAMNTMRNGAEKSTTKVKGIHNDKISHISNDLHLLKRQIPGDNKIKFNFDDSQLHKGKILAAANDINFAYDKNNLWNKELNFTIRSGERIVFTGNNGSGKTTLINIVIGKLEPTIGSIKRAVRNIVYIDQNYSLLEDERTIYEQAQHFNINLLEEHEVKIRLDRFLFSRDEWDKTCTCLSGGEKMRLMICCLNIFNKSPDIIVLDEPTNNLDITNTMILSNAIKEYEGTLLVISHDEHFLQNVNISRTIELDGI